MIRQMKYRLRAANGERPSVSWGYLLYGILMHKVDGEFAEYMHKQNLKPLNQYITRDSDDSAIWKINLLDQASSEAVIKALSQCEELYSEHRGMVFKLSYMEVSEPVSTLEICNQFFAGEKPGNQVEIFFRTPCSFKSEEDYCIFPTAELIIKSLVNKWNAFTEDFTLQDEDAINELIKRSRISKYNLKSAIYHLKGAVIPSFTGNVTLSLYGPDPLVRLFNLIAFFSQYASVGIKTALGMGGCDVRWGI